MCPSVPDREPAPADAWAEPGAVLARAIWLQRAARSGDLPQALRGRNLALLTAAEPEPAAALFRTAATELGAHVAHVRPPLQDGRARDDLRQMGRMLGALYEAVECQGLPAVLVQRLADHAGVPVFAGLATPAHATAVLVAHLPGEAAPLDKRKWVVQGALIVALA